MFSFASSFARQGAYRSASPWAQFTAYKPFSRVVFETRAKFYSHTAERSLVRAQARPNTLFKAAGIFGVGLGVTALTLPKVYCDVPDRRSPNSRTPLPIVETPQPPPPPPTSSVNLYELSFGTVCGICAGVFIKKGAKALAFVFGGVFVLLQYLSSVSVVRVDWQKMGAGFEKLASTDDGKGNRKGLTVGSLWRWVVDFLTADFQPRASFIAGLTLGLRIG
ncbi:hypothetical protein PLICRDRAFT_698988 [Plicaturopsis crispa FD-325 SS-3]|nr:hypothetical protein PLICRDRAFT_698988 [Plicaturopsis crispa FD-325 SS-3]